MTTTVRAQPPSSDTSQADVSAVDPLVADMVARWRTGERPPAEDYLDRSDLWDHPEAALELIAEELVLRAEFGEPVTEADLARRFPRWQAQVQVLLDCQRALGPPAAPRFPAPGDRVGDFELLSELGRGSHGRVYLAAQPSLAGRPVVLKVAPRGGGEHLSLARLQHTHIVPLYSTHDFPDWGLFGLCMPYFGGVTLADLPRPGEPRPADTVPAPANEFLARAAPWEAVCWVGACLADALQYAHDRELVHLDLKPSNVLIAADGTPMLLDFHLAQPPMRAADPAPTRLGGTAGYMPPEQQAAMKAVTAGRPVPADVDGRADLYALGVLLGELWDKLAGRDDRRSVGLTDILAKCTAADAAGRYPSAAALAGDLRRHLMALPLKGVGNRSFRERWRKWRRRRPLALPLALTVAALLVLAGGLVRHADRQADRARAALRDGQARLGQGRYHEAGEACRSGQAALDGVPFHRSLRTRLADIGRAAERAEAAEELHRLCERVRPLYAAEVLPPALAREAAERCAELWDRREEVACRLADQPSADLERRWRTDLLDLGILTAHLGVRAAPPDRTIDARRRALGTLAEAEALLGPSPVLALERATLAGEPPAPTRPPETAWEHLAVGRARVAAGDFHPAKASLDRCLDPRSVWGHYYRGVCCLRLGEVTEAAAEFSACVALAPESGWCVYNRGVAYVQAGRPDSAEADFDRALALDPGLGVAYLGRATAHHRAGRLAAAAADLDRAAAAGVPRPAVEYQKALVHLAGKDRSAAVICLRACLAEDPGHAEARALLARLGGE